MNFIRLLLAVLLLPLAPACTTVPSGEGTKRIAITFDDAPRSPGAFFKPKERTRRLISGLRRAGVQQAAFFVNPGQLLQPHGAGGEQRLKDYVRGGHVIANHSFSHRRLSQMTSEAYLADIDNAEDWLRGRKGQRPWFRFPFLDEGGRDLAKRDAVRAGLASRGLRNGYVTVDASDWNMEQRTIEAVRAGRKFDRVALRGLYVESHVEAAEFYDQLARRVIGRSPIHVLLLHETDLAALWIDDLDAALRARGWDIVTTDAAYADPLRAETPNVPVAQGTLIEAMAVERGIEGRRWFERNSMPLANRLFNERVLRQGSGAL